MDFKALITSTLEQQKTDYRKMEERECTSGLNKKPQVSSSF